jgi:predicted DNA-binding antitoxin AbrB/MazE fold protein
MTISCPAVYENGVLRLREPLPLENGAAVDVVIVTPQAANAPSNIAVALAQIAAMPMETDDRGFSGADHDRVLYGPEGAR